MNINAVKDAMAQPVAEPNRDGLAARIISAVALAPPVLAAVYFGSPYFDILIAIVAAVMIWEWSRLCGFRLFEERRELAATDVKRPLWLFFGVLIVGISCLALLWLRADEVLGRETIFWLLVVVWATDTGAYAFGRLIGGPRLAPAISPKKTWAGLIGGTVCAAGTGAWVATILGTGGIVMLAAISAVIGVVSQGGDLAESWAKRRFGVKDASNIIPGHGGLFDRMDGLMAAAVTAAALNLVGKSGILSWL